jgi:hypothetical protein
MKKPCDQLPELSAPLHLWTYDAAVRALPYIRTVVRSLREHWVNYNSACRLIQRLDSRPGRPDRQTLYRRETAAQELSDANSRLLEAFDELQAIDVFCLDPVHGRALIPFDKGAAITWYVFDLFAPQSLQPFYGEPCAWQRPLERTAG